ncbi:MAG: YdcF family protein [Chloroflexota bacterium]
MRGRDTLGQGLVACPSWQGRLGRLLRRAALGAVLLPAGALLAYQAAYQAGAYLIVDDALAPSQAIIVLAGGYPVREWEAADLYRQGIAPRVLLVREWLDDPAQEPADERPTLEDRRQLLIQGGVPASAIQVADRRACMTADELEIAASLLERPNQPVILVTSKYHSRRVSVLWGRLIGHQPAALVRTAAGDPFGPSTWWRDRRFLVRVAREYVGLLTAALPLPRSTAVCRAWVTRLAPVYTWLGD